MPQDTYQDNEGTDGLMGKTAWVFAGQGAQSPGMGKSLYETSAAARAIFDMADTLPGRRISALCFEGPKEALQLTVNTQPCVFTVDMAAAAALGERGFKPDVSAGFSLGEYAALSAAGVFSFPEGLKLTARRAEWMDQAVPAGIGGMAAILKLDTETIERICAELKPHGVVEPVNYNCPGQTVIAGHKETVAEACRLLEAAGARTIPLPVSGPFHTSLMAPAAEGLRDILSSMTLQVPACPVYSNVTATPSDDLEEIRARLVRQVMSRVRWHETISRMLDSGIDTFVEIGPGKTLSGFIRRISPEAAVLNVEDKPSLEATCQALSA